MIFLKMNFNSERHIRKKHGFSSNGENLDEIKSSDIVFTSKYLESTQQAFHTYHSDDIIGDSIHYIKKNFKPTKKNSKNFLYSRIPVIQWFPTYDIEKNLVKDLVSGLTVINIF